jgi:Ca-activated chloride channel family protein
LEFVGDTTAARHFAPLTRSELTGHVTGPLASLCLSQTFSPAGSPEDAPIEALYRFPLPGDAAVTGVRVDFGDVEIRTTLKQRSTAEGDYRTAKQQGRQAALLTRESPDVFTLAVAGIVAGREVRVATEYVQLARASGQVWSLRIPLTTAPRYTRDDEVGSPHAAGQPLALARDPGHRFALDLSVRGADTVESPTHALRVDAGQDGVHVRLRDGDVLPDRDCVLAWRPIADGDRPGLWAAVQADPPSGRSYFLAACVAPPAAKKQALVAREVVLLVDHSGSMNGPKWAAADWAVDRFLAGLSDRDTFALGVFHDHTRWLSTEPVKATADAVRGAVAFLKAHKDNGGTNLGVALEQALDLPRRGDTASRHVLVLTDAEVTDAGRLLRLADREAARTDRRRVSVLCIDAAANATLATELAERGGGVAHFLTSNPEENDITTALDEVLADWSAPVWTALALEVNRPAAEAVGRTVSLRVPGPAAAIDVGDLPAGRAVWVAARVALDDRPLMFQLRGAGTDVLAQCTAASSTDGVPGVKALFGAQRIRRLEYLMHSGLKAAELRAELQHLGYDTASNASGTDSKVYAENDRKAAADLVRTLLVRESLECGLPSAETALVAVRTEAGRQIGATVVVANALPAGWGMAFLAAAAPGAVRGGGARMLRSSRPLVSAVFGDDDFDDDETTRGLDSAFLRAPPRAASRRSSKANEQIRVSIPAGRHTRGDGAVLYDSADGADAAPLAPAGRLTSLGLTSTDKSVTADAVGPELRFLLFVGNEPEPRARIVLADVLRQGGRRPLNVRWRAGQAIRLTIEDPAGRWHQGVPAMEIFLDWEA